MSRPTIFNAKHIETGETTEKNERDVVEYIATALGEDFFECANMSRRQLVGLAMRNVNGLKSGTSADITFGDYKFTK